MIQTYYHVTLTNNLSSIFELGLIPQIGHLSKLCGEEQAKIYLFPDQDSMENAILSWMGENIDDEFGEDAECCYLEISLPDGFNIQSGETGYECYCFDTIPPKYIKLKGTI